MQGFIVKYAGPVQRCTAKVLGRCTQKKHHDAVQSNLVRWCSRSASLVVKKERVKMNKKCQKLPKSGDENFAKSFVIFKIDAFLIRRSYHLLFPLGFEDENSNIFCLFLAWTA